MYTSIYMLPYTKWLSLPIGTRQKIAEIFNIPKLRATHVADNQILDDGYNVADIERAMSVESLQGYLHSTEKDLFVLFQDLLDQLDGKEKPVKVDVAGDKIAMETLDNGFVPQHTAPPDEALVIPKEDMQQVNEVTKAKKKRGRPSSKNAKAKTNS